MTDSWRNRWSFLGILAAFALLASGCGNGGGDGVEEATSGTTAPRGIIGEPEDEDEGELPQYGGRIIVGLEAETANWTPGQAQLVVAGTTVALSIFDPLVSINETGDFEPNLAESIEPSDDLSEWRVRLRPGIRFHDGSPLDAETVKWNIETLHLDPTSTSAGALNGAGLVEVEVLDDLTVAFRLSGPNSAFPDLLRGPAGWPVSRQAYEELGPDEFGSRPVGTGPFVFAQWTRDDRLIVRRNEDYWRTDVHGNRLPYLDEVEFRPIPDEDSRLQSLASDAVQVMHTLRGSTAKQVLRLAEERDFRGNVHVGNTSSGSIFNVLEPPVDDIRVRRALALAHSPLDVAVVLGDDGLVDISTGFFTKDSPWYSEVVARAYAGYNSPDPEAARALVEEYRMDPDRSDGRSPGDPIEIVYSCLPDPSLIEIAQLVQRLWSDVGFEVSLRQAEQAAHVGAVIGSADSDPPWRGDFMVACWRAGAGESDPLTAFQSYYGEPTTQLLNFTNFYHPEITEQLDILRSTADFEERYAAVERIGVIANEGVPQTWSPATPTLVGWRGDIRGIVSWTLPSGNRGNGTPGGYVNFREVWLDRS